MSVEESNEFDELKDIVKDEEAAEEPAAEKSEDHEPEPPLVGRGGTSAG
jgi:hypothetical protein